MLYVTTPFCLSVYVPTKTNYTNCLSVVTTVPPFFLPSIPYFPNAEGL